MADDKDKARKLNKRYKALGKSHGQLCLQLSMLLKELHPDNTSGTGYVIQVLTQALAEARRSYESAALPAAPGGPRSTRALATVPVKGQTGRPGPPREPFLAPSASCVPPLPPERALAALHRARSALVTRQAQLATCRACGAETAAYQEAAADIETLGTWLAAAYGTSAQAPAL